MATLEQFKDATMLKVLTRKLVKQIPDIDIVAICTSLLTEREVMLQQSVEMRNVST
jgi:hypothetical protein